MSSQDGRWLGLERENRWGVGEEEEVMFLLPPVPALIPLQPGPPEVPVKRPVLPPAADPIPFQAAAKKPREDDDAPLSVQAEHACCTKILKSPEFYLFLIFFYRKPDAFIYLSLVLSLFI